MSGHVVYRPSGEHECAPGVTYRPWPADYDIPPPFEGARLVDSPQVRDYPRGTVWECGDCGTTWVSRGAAPTPANICYGPGMEPVEWKRESRRARRKREAQGATPEQVFDRTQTTIDVPDGQITVPFAITAEQADQIRSAFEVADQRAAGRRYMQRYHRWMQGQPEPGDSVIGHSYQDGGPVPPGATLAHNATGEPESVNPSAEG